MDLSEIIKKVRLELGMSQEGLARELHVGFTSVNRWENGHTKPNQIARHALIELCRNNDVDSGLILLIEKAK
ncbi:helix-turn-helix transcriptional regulator [Lacrimispora sp. BS-2]|jgi:putative transcriptional regulator|uniref:Helix-turn-helix transcriptional regulator n=1 Tax=Lacrimispora sp. BS-2 TaxID=3151850 RepID=A0AAU7PLZ9_9FIRM